MNWLQIGVVYYSARQCVHKVRNAIGIVMALWFYSLNLHVMLMPLNHYYTEDIALFLELLPSIIMAYPFNFQKPVKYLVSGLML